MRRAIVMGLLLVAAAVVAADGKEGAGVVWSQPIGGRSPAGTLIPLQATDAGMLRVVATSGDGGMGFEISGPGGATLIVRSQTPDGGTEQAVGGPGGATLIVKAQAADAGAEFAVTGPGGNAVVVSGTVTSTQGVSRDGGYDWGVNVDNFPASYPVTGTATATQGTSRDGGYDWGVNVDNFPSSYAVTGTFWQSNQPTTATQGVSRDGGYDWGVNVDNFPASYPVTGTFWQTNQRVIARDGGDEFGVTGAGGNPVLAQASGGFWDSTATIGDTCTSTGTNATAAVPASSYISGYCTAAAYVGIGSTCASVDGGTIASCMIRAANEAFYYRTGAGSTTIACLSVTGTVNCPLFTASN